MIFRFHNGRIALPGGAVEAADIAVADGTLTAISNAGDAPAEREIDLEGGWLLPGFVDTQRSEEHTSELQSLMRTSYAVFCLKKKTIKNIHNHDTSPQPLGKTQHIYAVTTALMPTPRK